MQFNLFYLFWRGKKKILHVKLAYLAYRPQKKLWLMCVFIHTNVYSVFFFLHVCIFVSGYLALHSARNSFIIILSFSTLVTGCGDKYGSFTVQSKLSCCFCVLHYNCLPIIIYSEVFSFCHQPWFIACNISANTPKHIHLLDGFVTIAEIFFFCFFKIYDIYIAF